MVRWCVVSAFLLAPVSVKMLKGLTNLMIDQLRAVRPAQRAAVGCPFQVTHHRTIVPFMFLLSMKNYRPAHGLGALCVGWSPSVWAGQLTPKFVGCSVVYNYLKKKFNK